MKLRIGKPSFGKFLLLFSVASVVAAMALFFLAYRGLKREFPDVARLRNHYPHIQYQGPKQPLKLKLLPRPPAGWVTLGQVARPAIGAVLVSEDSAFYSHPGYDAKQLKEAIIQDWEEKRFARGASTITMQVVKNVFLSKEKTLYRKAKELILAVRLDRDVPKKKVLETYLNVAEWGEGIYGINAASHYYFKKSPSELTPKEGAFLAMLLPSPKRYSQSFRAKQLTSYASRTVKNVLTKMAQGGYITPEVRDAQIATPLSFEAASNSPPPEGHEEDGSASDESEDEDSRPAPVIEESSPDATVPDTTAPELDPAA